MSYDQKAQTLTGLDYAELHDAVRDRLEREPNGAAIQNVVDMAGQGFPTTKLLSEAIAAVRDLAPLHEQNHHDQAVAATFAIAREHLQEIVRQEKEADPDHPVVQKHPDEPDDLEPESPGMSM